MPNKPVSPPAEKFNFAQYLIDLNAARPKKIAYIDDQTSLSYAELAEHIQRFATVLLDKGLQAEDRVLLLMYDNNDWPVCFLGAIYAGIVPVAVNTLLTADDYAYMLQHSQCKAVMVSAALLPRVQEAIELVKHDIGTLIVSRAESDLPDNIASLDELLAPASAMKASADTHADDHAFWLYSSGTTGASKGTVHTHANPYWTAQLYGKGTLGICEQDICFSAAKLFFAYGLGNALSFPLSVGATVILMPDRPTPNAVFKRWIEHQPTIFFGAPTGFAAMLAAPDLPAKNKLSLRLASSAGEALPAELGERFTEHYGVEIIDGIGSTEMLHIYLSNIPGKNLYGTTGWPVPGYDIELRDDQGQSVADGETGELFIKGPSAALMYWDDPARSKQTFQGEWTKSGDKYIRNADGSYTYGGRSDDMLKVSGIYVSPFEVEATLMQHPAVLESAVVGKEDKDGLVKAKAFVVLTNKQQQLSEDELKAFVKARLAPYKYPRFIEFIDELPKTATGKIQRFKLRE